MIFDTKVSLSNHQCQLRSVENPKRYEEQCETVQNDADHQSASSVYNCSHCKKNFYCLWTLKAHSKLCLARFKKSCADGNANEFQNVEIIEDNELQTVKCEDTEVDHRVSNISVKENTDFMCKECNENFITVAALQNHFLSCHGDYSKTKKCFCGVFFSTNKSSELHKLTVHRTSVTHTSEKDRPKVANLIDNGSNNTSHSIDINGHDNSDLVTKRIEFKNIKREVSKTDEKLISYNEIKMEELSNNNITSDSIEPVDVTKNSRNGSTQKLKEHNNNGSMKTGLGKGYLRDADISFRNHPGKNNFRSQGGGSYYFNSYSSHEQSCFNSPYWSKPNRNNNKKKHKDGLHEYRNTPSKSKNYRKKHKRHYASKSV